MPDQQRPELEKMYLSESQIEAIRKRWPKDHFEHNQILLLDRARMQNRLDDLGRILLMEEARANSRAHQIRELQEELAQFRQPGQVVQFTRRVVDNKAKLEEAHANLQAIHKNTVAFARQEFELMKGRLNEIIRLVNQGHTKDSPDLQPLLASPREKSVVT